MQEKIMITSTAILLGMDIRNETEGRITKQDFILEERGCEGEIRKCMEDFFMGFRCIYFVVSMLCSHMVSTARDCNK